MNKRHLTSNATGFLFQFSHNPQPTKYMKSYKLENDNTTGYLDENKPFPIPEPPMWLGMGLAALLGGIFVAAIIVLYELTH